MNSKTVKNLKSDSKTIKILAIVTDTCNLFCFFIFPTLWRRKWESHPLKLWQITAIYGTNLRLQVQWLAPLNLASRCGRSLTFSESKGFSQIKQCVAFSTLIFSASVYVITLFTLMKAPISSSFNKLVTNLSITFSFPVNHGWFVQPLL